MSLTTDIPMSRIEARIPLSVRETIDRAAAMQGRTRTDFFDCGCSGKGGPCGAITCASCA